jgi:purine-binding chemotaxis protein CheW
MSNESFGPMEPSPPSPAPSEEIDEVEPQAVDWPAEAASPAQAPIEALLVALAGEWYGLLVEQVAGVEQRPLITPLPGVPSAILGLFTRQGEVLPAFDAVRALLGRPGPEEDGYLVIGRAREGLVGMLVDEVEAVIVADRAALQPPLPTVDGVRAGCIRGQLEVDGRWVTLLDLDRLLGMLTEGAPTAHG